MVSVAVARVLKQHREACNRWYFEARHRFPHLDQQAFSTFLQQDAAPLLARAEALPPAEFEVLVLAIYRHGLQLAGLRWCGHDSCFGLLQQAWQRFLPQALPLIRQTPDKALVALAHGLKQLADHPDADALLWLRQMTALTTLVTDLDDWLRAGQVLAWRCGMAHFRGSALVQSALLDDTVLLFVLDVNELPTRDRLQRAFAANRWWTPDQPPADLVEQRRVGGLAGMGGIFTALPQVFGVNDSLYVQSGERCFELHVDAYGASLLPAPAVTERLADRASVPWSTARNQLTLDGRRCSFPDIHSISSVACTHDTVALTSADTFQVIVLSRGGGEV